MFDTESIKTKKPNAIDKMNGMKNSKCMELLIKRKEWLPAAEVEGRRQVNQFSVAEGKLVMGSRRIFAPKFKLQVLDSYRKDADCRGNQRATARKYGIHRRQIQKWLQVEASLRSSIEIVSDTSVALNLCSEAARQRDDNGGESFDTKCMDKMSELPKISEHVKPEKEFNISLFPIVTIEESVKDEQVSEEEAENSSVSTIDNLDTDQPLDFTRATLSKRRSFSLQFKLEVLDAFRHDRICCGNQRATARKFGINRRQVQKWLGQEPDLRGEANFRGGIYRHRLGRLVDVNDNKQPDTSHFIANTFSPISHDTDSNDYCWDLSKSHCDESVISLEKSPYKSTCVQESDGILQTRLPVTEDLEYEEIKSEDNSYFNRPRPLSPYDSALCLVKNCSKLEKGVLDQERPKEISSDFVTSPVVSFSEATGNKVSTYTDSFDQRNFGEIYPLNHMPPIYHTLPPKSDHPYHSFHTYERLVHPSAYPLHLSVNTVDYYPIERDCYKPQYYIPSASLIHSCHSQEWLKNRMLLKDGNYIPSLGYPKVYR